MKIIHRKASELKIPFIDSNQSPEQIIKQIIQ